MFFPDVLKAPLASVLKSLSFVLKFAICAVLLQLTILPASAVIRDGGIDPSNLGKGEWIFSMTDATNRLNSHVAGVTNENSLMLYYKSQGIRYIIVKAGTGATPFTGCYAFPQFNSNLVNIAHANGILIMGYNRSYATNVAGEVAIANYVFNQGADGFIWDAESEWEAPTIGSQGPSLAWQQCSIVRSNWPNKFLAHSPFAIISLHNTFPYKEFGYWCDAVMPQVYHFSSAGLKGSISAIINWNDVNFQNWQNSLANSNSLVNAQTVYWTNSIKPVVPIQDVYGPGSVAICEGVANAQPDRDVQEFIDYCAADPNAATPGGYKGVNFFRCDLHGTAQWSYIKEGTSGDFSGIVSNIVLDDARASVVGPSWASQRVFFNAAFFGTTETNTFGTNYLYTSRGIGSNYVQFTPNVATAGDYDVYERHPYHTNASANVPHVINYNGGSASISVNQQENSGIWNFLGRFNFTAGTAGNIRVTDGFPEGNRIAMADGLKLVNATAPAVPPGISSVTVSNITYNSVIIAWQTDLPANSIVDYGSTTNYGFSFTNSTLVSSHSVTLTGLNPQAVYHFRIRAKSSAPVAGVSGDFHFTTLPPGIVPFATIVDNTNATVVGTWSTGTSSAEKFGADYRFHAQGTGTNYLQYNPSLASSGVYEVYEWHPKGSNRTVGAPHVVNYWGGSQTVGMNQMVNGAQWNLVGAFEFAAGTNGGVQITDGFSDTNQLVMADAIKFLYVAPPHLLNVSASPRFHGAIITWTSFPHASSQVQYGLTTNLGSATAMDAAPVINHLVWLTGLTPATTYYYRVISGTDNGQYISDIKSFFTDPSVIVDAPHASYAGVWTLSTAAIDKFSPYFKYATTSADGETASATFRPNIILPGLYDVYLWYATGTNRSQAVPVSIAATFGEVQTTVDQSMPGGSWQLLAGNQFFTVGTEGFVQLGNGTGENNRQVIADAVRFSPSPGQDVRPDGSVPAWWASYYFGVENVNGSDDPDGDGYSNYQEYVMGTSPQEAGSHLELRNSQMIGAGSVKIIFTPFQSGRIYQVQKSTGLNDGAWLDVNTAPATVNAQGEGVLTVTNLSNTENYLRLSVQIAP